MATAEELDVSELPSYIKIIDGSEDPYSIPQFEAVWGFFVMVVEIENRDAGGGRKLIRTIIGSDETKADEVFNFIRTAVEGERIAGKDRVANKCSRLSEVRSSRVLAAELRDVEQSGDAERALHTQSLYQVLEPMEEAMLLNWIDSKIRSNMAGSGVDWDEYLSQDGVDVEDVKNRLCGEKKFTIK